MSSDATKTSFNDIIQAGRRKRKAQNLADEILGAKRTASPGNGAANGRKPPTGPSLASRMGITKRSSSAPRPQPTNTQFRKNTPFSRSGANPTPSLRRNASTNALGQVRQDEKKEINIKGVAGPAAVMASNFAPGTTAADIEAVMAPVGGSIISCRLVSSHPTVIAELVFQERQGAEKVVTTFNNQKADGKLLYVYMKGGVSQDFSQAQSQNAILRRNNDRERLSKLQADYDMMDESTDRPQDQGYRSQYTQGRVDYQDGRYGFNSTHDTGTADNGWNPPRNPSNYNSNARTSRYDNNGRLRR